MSEQNRLSGIRTASFSLVLAICVILHGLISGGIFFEPIVLALWIAIMCFPLILPFLNSRIGNSFLFGFASVMAAVSAFQSVEVIVKLTWVAVLLWIPYVGLTATYSAIAWLTWTSPSVNISKLVVIPAILYGGFAAWAVEFRGIRPPEGRPATELAAYLNASAGCVFREHGQQSAFPAAVDSSGCFQGFAKLAETRGVKLSYSAAGGAFRITAVQRSFLAGRMQCFAIDQTGLVRECSSGHLQPGGDEPEVFGMVLARILEYKRQHGTFPATILEVDRYIFHRDGDDLTYKQYRYRLTETRSRTGETTGFVLTARPNEYGRSGIRSYMADETGVVHATPEDRDALASDPLADRHEVVLNPNP